MLKKLLLAGLVATTLLTTGVVATGVWVYRRAAVSTVGTVAFDRPVAILPLAPSRIDARGRRVFDLTAAEGSHDFGGGPVPSYGFNGAYLGPTLRASRANRCGQRHQPAAGADHRALARHAPARGDGRRAAPTDRAGRDLVPDLADRPARGDPLVPPAPARPTRGRSTVGWPDCSSLDDPAAEAPTCRATTAWTTSH